MLAIFSLVLFFALFHFLILVISLFLIVGLITFLILYSLSSKDEEFLQIKHYNNYIEERELNEYKYIIQRIIEYEGERTKEISSKYSNKLKNLRTRYKKFRKQTAEKHQKKLEKYKQKLNKKLDLYFTLQEYADVLNLFNIDYPRSCIRKVLDDLKKNISTLFPVDEDFHNRISERMANEISEIDHNEILKLLYYSHFDLQGKRQIWNEIKKNKNQIENFIRLLLSLEDFHNTKSSRDNINLLNNYSTSFKLKEYYNKYKLLMRFERLHRNLTPFNRIFNIPHHREKVSENLIINGVYNKKDIRNLLEVNLKVIGEYFSEKVDNKKKLYSSNFNEIALFLILREILRDQYPEVYLEQAKIISKSKSISILIWKIYKSYIDYRDFLKDFINQKENIKKFLELKIPEGKIEDQVSLIEIFRRKLSRGELLLEKDKLFSEYMRDTENKCDGIDYLFRRLGDIDYQYLYRAIFNKGVTYENLSQIVMYKNDFIPFLLTYESGITKYINKILNTSSREIRKAQLDKEKELIVSKYTRQARIGIITKGFDNIEEFRDYFYDNFRKEFFNRPGNKTLEGVEEENEKDKGIIFELKNLMVSAILEQKRRKDSAYKEEDKKYEQELLDELETLRDQILAKLNSEELPTKKMLKFKELCNHPGCENKIDKVLNAKSILIHPLFPDKLGIQSIEIVEKYAKIFDKIKEHYIESFENKTMSAALLYGEEIDSISFFDLFKEFLKFATFSDLIIETRDYIKLKRDLKRTFEKLNLRSADRFINQCFGKNGRDEFLKSYESEKELNNLRDYSKFIIEKLNINIDKTWSPKLIDINHPKLEENLARDILRLNQFWKEKFKESIKEKEERKKLEKYLKKLSKKSIFFIIYLRLVLIGTFDLESLERYKDDYKDIRNSLEEKFGKELKSDLEEHHIFKKFLYYTIRLLHDLKIRPINLDFSLEEYKSLELDADLEKCFQNRVFGYYKPNFNAEIHREVEFARIKIDFQVNDFPVELKVKKSNDKQDFKDFVSKHINQISDYCCKLESEIGCLMIYDNSKVEEVNPNIPDTIFVMKGKVSEEFRSKPKKPRIIVIRVPNYLERSSDL